QKDAWSSNLESRGNTVELPPEVLKQLANSHPNKKGQEANILKGETTSQSHILIQPFLNIQSLTSVKPPEHQTTPTRSTNGSPSSSLERFPSSWQASPGPRAGLPLPSVELPSSPLNHKTSHVARQLAQSQSLQHDLDQDDDDDSDDLEILT